MTAAARSSAIVAAPADAVFRTLTDIAGLPQWNAAMTAIIEQPDRLEVGAEWMVEFQALGQTWRSRSVVEELDEVAGRFVYRSATDDGSPSFARWTWEVTAEGDGSRVAVAWQLHPATFWRRALLVRIRARQLARTEVPASLAALSRAVVDYERRAGAQPAD